MPTDEHEAVISRLTGVLEADDRVRAAWIAGSVGRGTADRYSDVDLLAAVSSHDLDAFVADWPRRIRGVIETVLLQRHGGGATHVFTHVTPDWLRFDLVVTTVYQVSDRSASTLKPLFDHDDIHRLLRGRAEFEPPSATAVSTLIEEFFRVLGLLPVVLGREELFVAASGAGLLRNLVMRMMLADASVTDGGALSLSRQLPAAAMARLDALPPVLAQRDAVVAAHLACAEVFLPVARGVAARAGVAWPAALERACRGYLGRELGIELAA